MQFIVGHTSCQRSDACIKSLGQIMIFTKRFPLKRKKRNTFCSRIKIYKIILFFFFFLFCTILFGSICSMCSVLSRLCFSFSAHNLQCPNNLMLIIAHDSWGCYKTNKINEENMKIVGRTAASIRNREENEREKIAQHQFNKTYSHVNAHMSIIRGKRME